MNHPTESPHEAEVCLFEEALPGPLFDKLVDAVRAIGNERMKNNGSYTTTFWFPRDAEPSNLAEDAIVELLKLVAPDQDCIGTEWWLGRLGAGKKLNLHFDRDLALSRETGKSVHPILSSVFYLNDFAGSPTVILDQVLAADGKTKIPAEPEFGNSFEAVANHYVVFPGNLRHGVIPNQEASTQSSKAKDKDNPSELRLTLLVNYWHRRPLEPVCLDYDGTIYAALKENRI
jgi:hypothetical protein